MDSEQPTLNYKWTWPKQREPGKLVVGADFISKVSSCNTVYCTLDRGRKPGAHWGTPGIVNTFIGIGVGQDGKTQPIRFFLDSGAQLPLAHTSKTEINFEKVPANRVHSISGIEKSKCLECDEWIMVKFHPPGRPDKMFEYPCLGVKQKGRWVVTLPKTKPPELYDMKDRLSDPKIL